MPSRISGSSSTLTVWYSGSSSLSVLVAAAEKPHIGWRRSPFMNSTRRWSLSRVSMRSRVAGSRDMGKLRQRGPMIRPQVGAGAGNPNGALFHRSGGDRQNGLGPQRVLRRAGVQPVIREQFRVAPRDRRDVDPARAGTTGLVAGDGVVDVQRVRDLRGIAALL